MFVRLTTISGDPDKLDAAVEYAENTARAMVEGAPGNKGFATLTDAAAGTMLAASYWDTAENRAASEGALADPRNQAGSIAGGDVTIENFELVAAQRFAPPTPGILARFIRSTVDPDRAEDAIAFYRDELLPRLQAVSGVVSAQLFVDRESGKGLSVTAWTDDAALGAAKEVLDEARALAADKTGVEFTGVDNYTLVKSTAQLD